MERVKEGGRHKDVGKNNEPDVAVPSWFGKAQAKAIIRKSSQTLSFDSR